MRLSVRAPEFRQGGVWRRAGSAIPHYGSNNDPNLDAANTMGQTLELRSSPGLLASQSLHPMPLKIYLVEDNPVISQNLGESLEELASARMTGVATNELDACHWLKRHCDDWDLAVIDLFLLQGNGLGVLACCADRDPQKKMVVLTNYATDLMRQRCLDLGADAVFDKSNELDEFTDFVRELGHQRQAEKQAQGLSATRL